MEAGRAEHRQSTEGCIEVCIQDHSKTEKQSRVYEGGCAMTRYSHPGSGCVVVCMTAKSGRTEGGCVSQ